MIVADLTLYYLFGLSLGVLLAVPLFLIRQFFLYLKTAVD